ncbi:unnamed protein product [Rotaria socialis]|uniref:Reverse transcriptase domain-containing protein n=1 Tax=Rotaria socialis TaxID=392032 RepID=A0A817WBV3_9BILA|nr:unnamed protein product [Rotaria socialis]
MRQLIKEYRMQTMSLHLQSITREREIITDEMKNIIQGILPENDKTFNGEENPGSLAFKHYNDLREKRLNLEAEQSLYFFRRAASRERSQRTRRNCCPDSYKIVGRGFLAPTIRNEAKAKLTEEEYQLLKLGPRFIYNDPKAASRRRTTELTVLKRKIETRFFKKKASPGRSVDQFIAELDRIIKNLHDTTINKTIRKHKEQREIITYDNLLETIDFNQYQLTKCPITTDKQRKQKNYGRLIKRLKHKLRSTNIVIKKTDKSKVFHLGKLQDYHKKSEEYMEKTEAYECLHQNDPLPNLIESTNKYLLKLRLDNWITQKQYEQLSIKKDEVELAHLFYLSKAHKPGTPLRSIVSGLKHPTIKISRFLDELLRPLFDRMASSTTVTSGIEVIKQLYEWSKRNARQDTLICTMDVIDLYTMIPQTEGILAIKKMLDYLNLKQINGLKIETIIRLCRFVVRNNYFSYDSKYYHQIRGGAMGSPLTLTIANAYMFFFERDIVKQINNSNGLYIRYIDDIFITINWSSQHLEKQIDRWNKFDLNIKLKAEVGYTTNFLDLYIENKNGAKRCPSLSKTIEKKGCK